MRSLEAGVEAHSAEAMRALARALAAALPPDQVLAFHGDLGVGKTTFVQGLAEGFGVAEPVTSPTFNLFHLYRGTRTLVHLDAYRLASEEQMEELMVEDFLESPWCLAVEWPSRIPGWLPPGALHLELSIVSPGVHRVRVLSRAPWEGLQGSS